MGHAAVAWDTIAAHNFVAVDHIDHGPAGCAGVVGGTIAGHTAPVVDCVGLGHAGRAAEGVGRTAGHKCLAVVAHTDSEVCLDGWAACHSQPAGRTAGGLELGQEVEGIGRMYSFAHRHKLQVHHADLAVAARKLKADAAAAGRTAAAVDCSPAAGHHTGQAAGLVQRVAGQEDDKLHPEEHSQELSFAILAVGKTSEVQIQCTCQMRLQNASSHTDFHSFHAACHGLPRSY